MYVNQVLRFTGWPVSPCWSGLSVFFTGQRAAGEPVNLFYKEEKMLPEKQKAKYKEFYDAARYNEILEPKTTLMLHLASAMAIGCYP